MAPPARRPYGEPMSGEESQRPAGESDPPGDLCPTCLGAGKVVRFVLHKGRTTQIWLSCPRCGGPSRLVAGP
jgi:DnaJ-class molecular chaperone